MATIQGTVKYTAGQPSSTGSVNVVIDAAGQDVRIYGKPEQIAHLKKGQHVTIEADQAKNGQYYNFKSMGAAQAPAQNGAATAAAYRPGAAVIDFENPEVVEHLTQRVASLARLWGMCWEAVSNEMAPKILEESNQKEVATTLFISIIRGQ